MRVRLVTLGLAFAFGAAALGAQPTRVAPRDTVQVRVDSVFLRLPLREGARLVADSMVVRLMPQSAEQLLKEVMTLRERETRLVTELRNVSGADVAAHRRLVEQLQYLSRERFALMSVVESRCAAERLPRPKGYLGLNLTSTLQEGPGGAVRLMHATVESVDPGSPAQQGGVEPGDRLLAIAGRDFVRELPVIDDLLVPGRRLAVRVSRADHPREVTVTVAARPAGFGETCGEFERVLQPLRVDGPTRFVFDGTDPGTRRVTVRSGTVSSGGVMAPVEETQIYVFGTAPGGGAVSFFGGAEFRTLSDDWREVLGMKTGLPGVLVTTVAAGSPAAQAGLKSGDVVTAVAGSNATSPQVLVRLLSLAEGREVPLAIQRGREQRSLTFRAPPPR